MGEKKRGRKGRKNLIPHEKGVINQHGVLFTDKEKKQLESLVNSANRKRRRMLKNEAELNFFVAGRNMGRKIEEKQRMGFETDFVLKAKSKSLNRFTNKEEYRRYVLNLQRVVKRDYVTKRVELYKNNMITAMERELGYQARGLIKQVKEMSVKDFMKMSQQDHEILNIDFIYSEEQRKKRIAQIRNALNRE